MTQMEFCSSFQEGRVHGAGPGKEEGGSEGPPGTEAREGVSEGLGPQGAWGRRSLGLTSPLSLSHRTATPANSKWATPRYLQKSELG